MWVGPGIDPQPRGRSFKFLVVREGRASWSTCLGQHGAHVGLVCPLPPLGADTGHPITRVDHASPRKLCDGGERGGAGGRVWTRWARHLPKKERKKEKEREREGGKEGGRKEKETKKGKKRE